MASTTTTFSTDPTLLWIFSLPAILSFDNLPKDHIFWTFTVIIIFISLGLSTWAFFSPGGPAWKNARNEMGLVPIPGPSGWPIFGSLFTLSRGLAHRTLAILARVEGAKRLMAFSLGSTPVVVTSDPDMAREILTSPHFADRPIKYSAKQLMFSRAIGFAPNGTYWRLLRRIASTNLFAPKRILAHEGVRMEECNIMINTIAKEHALHGVVSLRKHLQGGALNNIMGSVFGKRYDFVGENVSEEAKELHEVVKQGFELLGAFNWCDHLPWLNYFYDPSNIVKRCSELVPRVHRLVRRIIDEHRDNRRSNSPDGADFVDVLLSLDGDEKLEEDDMIAVLWEMIFRGTDTIALLIEWIIAELVLNPKVQSNLQLEIDTALSTGATNSIISKLPYLQAVVKETLRVHPPGPLLSWARLSSDHVHLSNGMVIPKGTTAMVNMWAITHDSEVWDDPLMFKPERFMQIDVDVRGGDLRLAPFGAGRRVCPGKDLGLTTVSQWVAMLVHNFEFVQDVANPVDLSEILKLSCEMKRPLSVVVVPRK